MAMRSHGPSRNGFMELKRAFDIDTLFLEIPSTGMQSNAYAINDANATILVDTGQKTPSNIRVISRYIERKKKPVYLLLTHEHTDHIGLAKVLQERYASRVFIHENSKVRTADFETNWDRRCTYVSSLLARSGFPAKYADYFDRFRAMKIYAESFVSDEYVKDGDVLDLPGRTIRVIHTPGHSAGSVCYFDGERKLLFCGDHVVGGQIPSPTIDFLGNGTPGRSFIRRYIESFAKLERFAPVSTTLPGHGNAIEGLGPYKESYSRYFDQFNAVILDSLRNYGTLTPFGLYMLVYKNKSVKSMNNFFGRIQILFSVLDLLESGSFLRRERSRGTLSYSLVKGS